MVEVEWTQPESIGSFWPPFTTGKKPNQIKRSVEQIRQLKADFRRGAMLDHMRRLGIASLDYRLDVQDRLKQIEIRVEQLTAKPETASIPSNVVQLPVQRRVEPDYFQMPLVDLLALTVAA